MRKFLLSLFVVSIFSLSLSLAENNSLNGAISWMNQKGLTKFSNSTDFMSDKGLRRDEASKFFVQYAKEVLGLTPDTTNSSCNFTDLNQARPDLTGTIKEACQLGLFNGYNGKFMPTQSLTNAQALTVLIRILDGKKDETKGHFAQKYFEKAQELGITNGLSLDSSNNFDTLTTRGDVGILLFNSSNLPKKNSTSNKTYYTVTRVVDGDTIEISSGGKLFIIRLIGVDTPETVDTTKPIQCFGKEASNKTKEKLLNKEIYIINDDTQNDKDIYDRLLRYVYLKDGTFFNEWLIENGYAMEYTYKKAYIHQTQFKNHEEYARKNKMGLWADGICGTTNTNTPTTVNNTTSSTTTNHIFYTSSHYTSKTYYCDTDSAWKGLSTNYLKSYSSESDLLKAYLSKKLHEACK